MKRIVGVDVARGLAVLGMMTAHVGVVPPALWSSTGWLAVADGRSAATFAVLSGVSVALLSGGPQPVAGTDLFQSRVKIGIRAVLLLILGVLLTGLGTPVAVILQSYAAYFLLVLPVLRAAPAVLLGLATLMAVVGPPVCFALGPQVVHQPDVATHVAFVVIALVVASGWRAWLGRGPLELLLHGLSTDTAKAVTRTT